MFKHLKKNILGGKWAFTAYLLYGGFLMFLLFQTVHDRTEKELELRINHRYERVIQVWIDSGFLKHGGMWFNSSVDENPEQSVHKSIIMSWLYGAYLLERLHVVFSGEFSPRLMTYHNQLIPMVSSAFLGLLAMRLVIPLGVSLSGAFLLGIGVQTAYQTFPLNLGLFWETGPQVTAIPFALVFLLIEEYVFNKEDTAKLKLCRGLAIFFMFLCDFQTSLLFILSYVVIKAITVPKFNPNTDFKTMFVPAICATVFWISQTMWVIANHPGIKFDTSGINFRTGFDGSAEFYSTHLELFDSKYHYVFPSWNTMWILGVFALIAVIVFVQKNRKLINHQTILLAGLALYIPTAFLFSQAAVIHVYMYEPYLAVPFYLAIFALLPAWLESFSNHSGKFVFFATLIAFSCSGIQLLAYFLHVPPYFYV